MAVLAGKLEAWRERLRARGRQIDAQPARTVARNRHALPQDQPRSGGDRGPVRRPLPRGARKGAQRDHSRPRRDRRPSARPSGRPVLSRLLRLLLLSAALCVLRPASSGGQAEAVEHRRQRRSEGGDRADRRPDPGALAEDAHSLACRFRFRPRGVDGLVRTEPDRFRVRPRPQRAARRWRSKSNSLQAEAEASSTGKPARRFKDFRYATLDSWSRRRRVIGKAEWTKGEANPRFIVTSLKKGRDQRPLSLRESLLRPRRHGEPHQGMPGRPVRRPHLDRHPVRQPAQALARLVRLCSHLRGQARRPRPHSVRRGHMRHDQAQAPQARRPRPHQRAAHQVRGRLSLSLRRRMAAGRRPPRLRRRCDADKSRQFTPRPTGEPKHPDPTAQTAPPTRSFGALRIPTKRGHGIPIGSRPLTFPI